MNTINIAAVLIFATLLTGQAVAELTSLNVSNTTVSKQVCNSIYPWNVTMGHLVVCHNQSRGNMWVVSAFVYLPNSTSVSNNSKPYLVANYLPAGRKIKWYVPLVSNSTFKSCINYNNTVQCLYTTLGKVGWSKNAGWYAWVYLNGTETKR